jgi:hypothetical protein
MTARKALASCAAPGAPIRQRSEDPTAELRPAPARSGGQGAD